MSYTFRELTTHEDFLETIALQKEAWGENFRDLTPPSTMVVNMEIGGFSAGVFDDDRKMQGFVFGLTGIVEGEKIQWSQKLAMSKKHQGKGLGAKLKEFQREQVLQLGYETIYWTYDPLQAMNANLNINRLGVKAVEYIKNWYPIDEKNLLQANIGTDRFIVKWELTSPMVEERLRTKFKPSVTALPPENEIVNTELKNGISFPEDKTWPDRATVFVEIPEDINDIGIKNKGLALAWRENTRDALQHYLNEKYCVSEFLKIQKRCFYLLEKNS